MKTRSNTAAAILSNTTDLENAYVDALNAEGSALKENEKYMDSIQGRIDQFNNAVQALWSKGFSDFIKTIINAGTGLVKIIDYIGLIRSLCMGLLTFIATKHFKGDLIGGLFGKPENTAQSIEQVKKMLGDLATARDKAKEDAEDSLNPIKKIKAKNAQKRYDNAEQKATPILKEYDDLQNKMENLQKTKDSLTNDLKQAKEDQAWFWSQEDAAGLEESSKRIQQIETDINKANAEIDATQVKIDQLPQSEAAAAAGATNLWDRIIIGAKNARNAVWKYIKQTAKAMLQAYAITTVLELGSKLISHIYEQIDNLSESTEEAQEAFENAKNELDENKSELESLNSELSDTQDKIDDLIEKGTLSFTEQEELDKLKEQNSELERQIALRQTLQETLQKGANAASVNATTKYLNNTSFDSDKTKTERQEEDKETGEIIGQIAGAIIGTVIGAGITVASGGTLAVAGLGLGSLVGQAVGGLAGASISGYAYDKEQSVQEAINSMRETRQKLVDEQEKALEKGDTEAYNSATEALNNYDTKMAEHISLIQQNYNAMDWLTADPNQRQAMKEQADLLDAYSIAMKTSGSKSSAISRIFGEEATDGLKKAKKAWEENTNEAKDFSTVLKDSLSDDEYNDFILRLRDMGLYIYDLDKYFKEVKEDDDELSDNLTTVADDINKVTDALDSLKSAFDEINEKGYLTVKTFEGLKEKFQDNEDAFAKYANTVLSGVSSTQEMIDATEELAKAYVDENILNGGEITSLERIEYIVQLKEFDVTNAEEYVDDKIRENAYNAIKNEAGYIDASVENAYKNMSEEDRRFVLGDKYKEGLSWYDIVDDEELKKLIGDFANLDKVIDTDTILEKAEEYSIVIDNIDEVKSSLEELANAEAKLKTAQDKKDEYDTWIEKYKNRQQDYDMLKSIVNDMNQKFNLNDWYYDWDTKLYTNGSQNLDSVNYQAYSTFATYWSNIQNNLNDLSEEGMNSISNNIKNIQEMMSSPMGYSFLNDLGVNVDTLSEYVTQISEYSTLLKDGIAKGWVNEDGTLVEGVDKTFADAYNAAKKGVDELEDKLESELTADVQLKIDLQNKSQLVDDIQSVYDDLYSAAEEYKEQGFFNVDTTKKLLKMDAKYLALLYDENGNLNLNKESLLKVTQARLYDTGLKQLEIISENALVVAKEGSIEKMEQLTKVYEKASDSMTDYIATQKQAIIVALAARDDLTDSQKESFVSGIESQMNAVYKTTMSSINNMRGAISSSDKTANETAKDNFDKLAKKFDNQIQLLKNEKELLQAEMDKDEARNEIVSENYYKRLIELEEEEKQKLIEKQKALQDYLDANGSAMTQDNWTEANNEINETAKAIKECEKNMIDYGKSIENVHWEYFTKANEEIDGLADEIKFVQELLEDENNVADENGNWSSDAITQLGLYMNQMEYAAAMTSRYTEEINKVGSAWTDYQKLLSKYGSANNIPNEALAKLQNTYGYVIQSESEYQEKLTELTSSQQNAVKSYEDAKDGIVNLNKARVDAIKEGIDKEIEAYKELIDLKKKELSAERDLYDFKKSTEEKTKSIGELERKIAALSGSTAASDVAERRKLEAELRDAQTELSDSYYDHAKSAQETALDDEQEAYEKSRDDYTESLDEMLKNTEELIKNTLMDVLFNADIISQQLVTLENTYGIELSAELKKPWEDASAQAIAYKNELQNSMTSGEYAALIGEGGAITAFSNGVANKLQGSWDKAKVAVNQYADFLNGAELGNKFSKAITSFTTQIQSIIDKWNDVKKASDAVTDKTVTITTVRKEVGGTNSTGDAGGGPTYEEPQKKYAGSATGYIILSDGTNVVKHYQSGRDYSSSSEATTAAKNRVIELIANALPGYKAYTKLYQNTSEANKKKKEYAQKNVKWNAVSAFYAKGTTGTKQDQWAITDEPQWGDELTLVPGKDGNLSFMRKGTGVVPAKLTERIMELAMQNPSDMTGTVLKPTVSNVATTNNAAINLSFESFIKAENISDATMEDLDKMVDKKIDKFSRELNYALRRIQ